MNLILDALRSMDDVVTGKVAMEAMGVKEQSEQEIVIYAEIGDMEGLAQAATIEQHEQAEIKTDHGRIRVRKTTQNGRLPTFDITSKKPVKNGAMQTNIERTRKTNEETFNMFIDICPSFMVKTRYTFKAERLRIKRENLAAVIETKDLAFEVDVFTKADGSISKWCKIDIETQKIAEILKANNIGVQEVKLVASISGLPFKPTNIAIDSEISEDPDLKEFVKLLYAKEFLIKRR